MAEKLHVPVSETAEWAALTDHVAEIDKTCALLAWSGFQPSWRVPLVRNVAAATVAPALL